MEGGGFLDVRPSRRVFLHGVGLERRRYVKSPARGSVERPVQGSTDTPPPSLRCETSNRATQESISTPLLLQPSSTLGSKQFKTNQDKLDRSSSLVDRKRQRVYDAVAEKKKGYHSDEDASEGDDDMPVDNANEAGPPTPSLTTLQSAPLCATKGEVRSEQQPTLSPEQKHTGEPTSAKPSALHLQAAPVTVGSGLKKGPDGQAVVPVIVKRTRKPIERVRAKRCRTW